MRAYIKLSGLSDGNYLLDFKKCVAKLFYLESENIEFPSKRQLG